MKSIEHRCAICGRLCGEQVYRAEPYKKGYACQPCYVETVIPSKKWVGSRFYKYVRATE